MTVTEEWRPIPGWDMYDVSDLGRIRSWQTYNHSIRPGARAESPRILRLAHNGHGYLGFTARRPGLKRTVPVHVAVMLAFVGPKPEAPQGMIQIRHLDDSKENNRLGNLTYGTAAQNMQDLERIGRGPSARAALITHCHRGHEFSPENTTYNKPQRPWNKPMRQCRACKRIRDAAYKARKRASNGDVQADAA